MSNDVDAGQAVYTPLTLALYDHWVLGMSCRWLWRCPSDQLLAHYQRHISANHLDVGVGSGYFLDQVQFKTPRPRLALLDLNAASLAHCARRIARYQPEQIQHNVLAPLRYSGERFDSLAMNFLLHCLPGDINSKLVALEHLRPMLNPGARVFGSTLLSQGVSRNLPARGLMMLYNRKGIFSNGQDDLAGLEAGLQRYLQDVEIRVEGCCALFSGQYR